MNEATEKGVGGAQAIRRAVDVIRAVAQMQRSGARLSRVAEVTGLNSSTAFRILRTLTEERMLRYDEGERCYYLGLLAFELGLSLQGSSRVQEHWRDAVEQVARRTRLTTHLMARSDNQAVCLLCEQGSTAIRAMPIDVGQRLPLGIGAGSLAILATLEDDEIERIQASQMRMLEQYPGGRQEALRIRDRVAAARREGYAVSNGSVAAGLSGVGVAVLPQVGLLQLAISVSAVADAIDPKEAKQFAQVIRSAIDRRLNDRSGWLMDGPRGRRQGG